MDHTEAANAHAVERYLLGEMEEPEAESFELHFFECTACSEELASAAVLAENIKTLPAPEPVRQAVARVAPAPGAGGKLLQWWRRPLFAAPAFAALALAFTVAYQARELALLREPRSLQAYTLRSGVRGGPQATIVPADKSNIEIRLDLPDTMFPRYRCDLFDSSGRRLFFLESEAPLTGDPLSIGIPRGLAPGAYTLKVQGIRDSQIGPEVVYRIEAIKS